MDTATNSIVDASVKICEEILNGKFQNNNGRCVRGPSWATIHVDQKVLNKAFEPTATSFAEFRALAFGQPCKKISPKIAKIASSEFYKKLNEKKVQHIFFDADDDGHYRLDVNFVA